MAVKALGISKKYFRKTGEANYFYALKKTDFEIKAGSVTVISGRSGGGKSTLLNMLAGILMPSEGTVMFDDTDIYKMNDKELSVFRNKHIGVIPQIQSALGNLTVMENVLLPASLYKNAEAVKEYASELLELLGLLELRDADASGLSGGEARRMAIARALVQKPDIILADEPTGDLDDENTKIVFELFRKIAANGAAVVVVTHENEAYKYADEVYRMSLGEITRLNP